MLKLITMGILLATMSACSSTNRNPSQEDTKVMFKDQQGDKKEAPAQATSNEAKEMTRINPDQVKEDVAAATQHAQHTATEAHHREAGPVSADQSLGWLKNGNLRFTKGTFRNDGAKSSDRTRLIKGQKPHAVVLSCSDSRVPPEIVFDQKLGEIFVIRTAGEALDNNVVGSIEYAVEHLGSNLIVVMGHQSCGAVKASLDSLHGSGLGSPALEALANDIKPRLQKYATTEPSPGLLNEVWANTDGVTADLLARSAILRDAVASGDVKIVKAMYHLDSGQVEWR